MIISLSEGGKKDFYWHNAIVTIHQGEDNDWREIPKKNS